MKLDSVGIVIAVREFSLRDEGGKVTPVSVILGMPQQFPDSSDYYAPYQITGVGSEKIRYAGGIDAFQALQGAMTLIGADLFALNEKCNHCLAWIGDELGDLGFPVPGKH
ncbi:MAG TPA: hypothetical protein VJ124_22960 [Pyrinomonadaceae bacterium]|nr:hypothetical protein [Pyrinomonadaceae bacterium]